MYPTRSSQNATQKKFSKNETKNDIEKLLVSPLITHKEHSEIVTDLSL